jgi:hypothetical protein
MIYLERYLEDKNILFLSVKTFNIEMEIIKKLEEHGARVTYYDERPGNTNFIKGIIRLKRSLIQNKIDSYYRKILTEISELKFDFFFLNRGEIVPEFFLRELRKKQLNCKFILNTWDSFANLNHPVTILRYFDRKYTFDANDAIEHQINFRPLFYLDAFKNLNSLDKEFDILFLGTAHSDRYIISKLVKRWATENELLTFCYYYMHGRLVYCFKKIFDKSFGDFNFRDLSFKPLKLSDIVRLYQKSSVILDVNHPLQSGLTMRTFEAIGAKKKLITTNRNISKYPFYNENNIFIIDRNNINLELSFFEKSYVEIDTNLYEKLSIDGWLYNLFVDSEESFWQNCL